MAVWATVGTMPRGKHWALETMNKTTLSFRAPVQVDTALQEIADRYGVNKSELLRGYARQAIENHEDILDDYMILAAKLDEQKEKAQPFQSVSHLPNNLHRFCREQIDEPYPIPVDEVAKEYYEPYAKSIEAKYPDDSEKKLRAISKLDHAMRMYEILHPSTDENPSAVKRACIHYAKAVMEDEDMDTARSWVQRRIDDGVLADKQRDEVFDALREERREKWQQDWQDAVRANWGG